MNITPRLQPLYLKTHSILVVENGPVLAFILEKTLLEVGFDVDDTARRLEYALLAIETGGFDAAVLEVNLAGVSAGPIARRSKRIP